MLLSDISYTETGPRAIEELAIWGIQPLQGMLDMFNEFDGDSSSRHAAWLYYEVKDRLDLIEKTLYRLANEMDGNRSLEDQNKDLIDLLPGYKQLVVNRYLQQQLGAGGEKLPAISESPGQPDPAEPVRSEKPTKGNSTTDS